jgi:hypothetical protein
MRILAGSEKIQPGAAVLYMPKILCHAGIPCGKFLQIFLEKTDSSQQSP